MNNWKSDIITYLLLILITLPFVLVVSISVLSETVAADNVETDNDSSSWLKGLILITVSLLTNYFFGEDESESPPEQEHIIIDRPLIDEKENQEREVLGFYVNWGETTTSSLSALKKNQQALDYVAPFWYTLNPDGSLTERYGGPQEDAISLASHDELPVLPLINNNRSGNEFLTDPEIRQKSVSNIAKLLQENNYSGVNIDFEFIPPETKNDYTLFIKELANKLQPLNKMLTVSVFPKVNVPYDLHGAYDYKAIEPHIDRMVIMTYDHNWSSGSPGPIAPLDWVEKNIEYTLNYLPPEKILLGIANYGYDWLASGNGQDLGAKEAKSLARGKNETILWDSESKTPYFTYQDNLGNQREVWFESSYSLEYKLELLKKYNLQGIAIWRLGNAEERFWDKIVQWLK